MAGEEVKMLAPAHVASLGPNKLNVMTPDAAAAPNPLPLKVAASPIYPPSATVGEARY